MSRFIRRLTFVSDAPHFGGAERYIVDMAGAARRRGIEPLIYWMPGPKADADVFSTAWQDGLAVETTQSQQTTTIRGVVRSFNNLLRREEPDGLVINASGRPRFWLLPWLATSARVPAVWVHQMVDACDPRRLPARRLGGRLEGPQFWRVPQALRHRLAATAATAVITLNAEDRERIVCRHGVRHMRIRAIPHGVDCERFRFDPAGRNRLRQDWRGSPDASSPPLIVGTAGRLSREKGTDLLIEATAILHRRGFPILAVIAGQGVERDALAHLAAARGIADRVKFIAFAEDMPAFYGALDVFVLCSRTESFGLALAEAMACERAVVATPTSGARRQIDHLDNGWQLRGWSAAELADAFERLGRDADRRHRMGRRGRESVVRYFSIDLTLERTLRALRGSSRERPGLAWPGMNDFPFAAMATEDVA